MVVLDKNTNATETLTMPVNVNDGWGPGCSPESSSGENCQVKRMVGLAKADSTTFPDGQNGHPGSYFGVQAPGTQDAIPTINETSPKEAVLGATLSSWKDTEWDSCPRAQLINPYAAVIVPTINPTGAETVGIQSQGFNPPSSYCVVYGSN
jgi:hypothetical protein